MGAFSLIVVINLLNRLEDELSKKMKLRVLLKPVVKISTLGGAMGGTYYVGVWNTPTDRIQLNFPFAQWSRITNNFMEDYVQFDSLKKVQVPLSKDTKEMVKTSASLLPSRPKLGADDWNSIVDSCIEMLFAMPSNVCSGVCYATGKTRDSVVSAWNQMNSNGNNDDASAAPADKEGETKATSNGSSAKPAAASS